MQFSTTNQFNASAAAVAEALRDPAFYASLDTLPDIDIPEVVAVSNQPSNRLTVRYRYLGQVDGIVRRFVGNGPVTWLQHTDFEADDLSAAIRIESEVARDLLRCTGSMSLSDTKETATRIITADLDVRVPLISGRLEQSLIPGIRDRIDAEAIALDQWLN